MKNKKVVISILATLFLIILAVVVNEYRKNKLYDQLDAAREEYRDSADPSMIYTIKNGDYVGSVSVRVMYDDDNLSKTWYHTTVDEVIIHMDKNFEELSMRKRCEVCVRIMHEIRNNVYAAYNNSDYCRVFNENKQFDSMRYRGISLYTHHKTDFKFMAGKEDYTFPSYGSMTVTVRGTKVKSFYEYSAFNGELEDFGERYASQKKDTPLGNTSTNKSRSTYHETYDPYDSKSYKSAQDFADDKYEEFYDYEDDYDDEDEAYDAAEDYWDEYN
ncbi:hypothetical protein [Butyrivibrio sp. FCS014]|uniref:hypothetical protein n=1 Tax=Butyrivibrio sp. FCS014 TaxID=1408304 RepID=UPI000464D452|nr:hypothetical protein [Butyrivibrio sp. FCS014]